MKIAYLGHAAFGAQCLQALAEAGISVQICVTHPGLADAHTEQSFPDVTRIAGRYKIPCHVLAPHQKDELREILEDVMPDLIVTVTWRGLLPPEVLNIPSKGAINLHGSLLPKYRGNAPVTWALLNGDKEIGATVHYIDEGMDTGDILEQVALPIGMDESVGDVFERLLEADGPMLVRAIRKIESGQAAPIPQNHEQATRAYKRKPEDGLIDWNQPGLMIHNAVRAQSHPLPGAYTFLPDGRKLFIWRTNFLENTTHCRAPGVVVSTGTEGISVAAVTGIVVLKNITTSYSHDNELEALVHSNAILKGQKLGSVE